MSNSKEKKLKGPMKKIIIVLLLTLMPSYSYCQFHYFYFGGGNNGYSELRYQDKYYTVNPRGLKQFIAETEMPNELKTDLTQQAKKIANKKTISKVAGYGLFLTGAGIMLNEGLSKKEGEEMKSATLFKGLGIAALGGVLHLVIAPGKKDYFNFINKFNEGKNDDKLKLCLKVDYDKQMNYGLALSF